jgi:hypothetical protein
MTIAQLERDISRETYKLKQRQVYENFGQTEVRKLKDKYFNELHAGYMHSQPFIKAINDFDDFCCWYTG